MQFLLLSYLLFPKFSGIKIIYYSRNDKKKGDDIMFNNSINNIIEQERAILSTMTIVERSQRIAMLKAIYGIDPKEFATQRVAIKK